MRAPAVIARVLAQLEKFLDVEMPGFEVRAHRAFSLAALINGNCGVIDYLEEWHDTL